jgi:oryzin
MQSIKRTLLLLGAVLPAVLAGPIFPHRRAPTTIPGKYIVTFKSDVDQAAIDKHTAWATDIHKRNLQRRDSSEEDLPIGIERNFKINKFAAYSGSFDEDTIAQIRQSDEVGDIACGDSTRRMKIESNAS